MRSRNFVYLVRLGLLASLGLLYFAVSVQSRPSNLRPYSVQMHVHASMSEGAGSWRGANVQAKKLGLDVLWWSDHDWRMAYHTYADGYDFEADDMSQTKAVPYPPGTDLSLVREKEMDVTLTPHRRNGKVKDTIARITAERASQGKKSLEIAATAAKDGFQPFFYEIDASRRRMKRSLASRVQVNISIYPDFQPDKETMAGVWFDLSQQPPDMEAGKLVYVLTGLSNAELAKLETASMKFVRLEFKPQEWNKYTFNLTEDAKRLRLGGIDNALVAASFGVLTKGKRAHAFFDDYRIIHQLKSEPLREEARQMAAALEKEYGVTNYVGQELSYEAHLNPLGEHIPMIDYLKHPEGLDPAETVKFVHLNGGVCSLNHIFGTSRPPRGVDPENPESARAFEDKKIQELTASRCFGADVLEVGYPVRVLPMPSFLRVWDALSNAGVVVVANGVSDSHSSTGGWFDGNNFVSWVWAQSKSKADIIDAFRRGNVFFGDPAQFKGQLTLSTDDGHQMGQVVITHKPSHQLKIHIEGLPAGARVRTVAAGKYGRDFTAAGGHFDQVVDVETSQRTFFRVETYLSNGRPLVFSNPIYFVPSEPAEKISPYKRAVCGG